MLQVSPGVDGRQCHQIEALSFRLSDKRLNVCGTLHHRGPHTGSYSFRNRPTSPVGWSGKTGGLIAGETFKPKARAVLVAATEACTKLLAFIAQAAVKGVAIISLFGRDWDAGQAFWWSGRDINFVDLYRKLASMASGGRGSSTTALLRCFAALPLCQCGFNSELWGTRQSLLAKGLLHVVMGLKSHKVATSW